MGKFFKRQGLRPLAHELRAGRPEPSRELVTGLTERVGRRRARGGAGFRVAFAGALTVVMLVALASVGGLSYAASSAKHTWIVTRAAVVKGHSGKYSRSRALTPAGQQYVVQKAKVCHNGNTLELPKAAVPAHLAHGDTMGPCHTGVAGASIAFAKGSGGGGSGGLGATLSSNLPFTGFPLWAAALMGLVLASSGLGLRRVAKQYRI
jgi:hypothetical protein